MTQERGGGRWEGNTYATNGPPQLPQDSSEKQVKHVPDRGAQGCPAEASGFWLAGAGAGAADDTAGADPLPAPADVAAPGPVPGAVKSFNDMSSSAA